MEGRVGRAKARKLMGWDKDSLIGKAKAKHASKANQGIHSLLPISRQVFSHLQQSRAPSRIMVTREAKRHHSECPPPSSFIPQLYALSTTSYSTEHPFGQLGSAVLAVPPPSCSCTPSLLAGGVGWEQERPWLCASTAQRWLKHPGVINAVSSSNPKQSPTLATRKKINSIPAKPSTEV